MTIDQDVRLHEEARTRPTGFLSNDTNTLNGLHQHVLSICKSLPIHGENTYLPDNRRFNIGDKEKKKEVPEGTLYLPRILQANDPFQLVRDVPELVRYGVLEPIDALVVLYCAAMRGVPPSYFKQFRDPANLKKRMPHLSQMRYLDVAEKGSSLLPPRHRQTMYGKKNVEYGIPRNKSPFPNDMFMATFMDTFRAYRGVIEKKIKEITGNDDYLTTVNPKMEDVIGMLYGRVKFTPNLN